MPRDDTYLLHILLSARRIATYTNGVSREQFMANGQLQDSVLHRVSNIGEISKRISADFKNSYPNIPWKLMAGMRDRIIHDYYRIDWELVWNTATESVPELIQLIEPIVPPEK